MVMVWCFFGAVGVALVAIVVLLLLYTIFCVVRCVVCRHLFLHSSSFVSWLCSSWVRRAGRYYDRQDDVHLIMWEAFRQTAPYCMRQFGVFTKVSFYDVTPNYWHLLLQHYVGLDRELLRSAPVGIKPSRDAIGMFWWPQDRKGMVSRRRCFKYLLDNQYWLWKEVS